MSSIIPPTNEEKTPTPITQPGVFRSVAERPVDNTDSTPSEKPPVSQSSSSELGVPGSYPRDPRVALDHLSEKAETAGTTVPAGDDGTILDAVGEDFRHAVDVASRYLPESVVGAFGSIIPVDTTDTEAADKKLDPGQCARASQGGTTKSLFNARDLAVGGIASDFTPSSGSSRVAPSSKHGATRLNSVSLASNDGSQSVENSFVSSDAVPASKEKRDDDVEKGLPASEIRGRGTDQSSELRKKAIETAALGAGIGTLGGAAYGYSRSSDETPSTGSAQPQALDNKSAATSINGTTRDSSDPASCGDESSSNKALGEQPAFVSYVPGPIITGEDDEHSDYSTEEGEVVPPTSAVRDEGYHSEGEGVHVAEESKEPDDQDDSADSNARAGLVAGTLGAGAGALGGAALASSHAHGKDPVSTPQVPFDQSATDSRTPGAVDKSSQAVNKGAGIAGGDVGGNRAPEDQQSRDTQSQSSSDLAPGAPVSKGTRDSSAQVELTPDSESKKKIEVVALGAGAGTLGGAAYATSRASGQEPSKSSQPQAPSDKSVDLPQPQLHGRSETTVPASTQAVPGKDTEATSPRSVCTSRPQAPTKPLPAVPEKDSGCLNDQDDTTTDSNAKKGLGAAALAAGAGILGGAAYHHSRSTEQDRVSASHQDQALGDKSTVEPTTASEDVSGTGSNSPASANQGATTTAGDVKATAQSDRDQQKWQKGNEIEIEKREKEVRKHEKDAAAAVTAADKRARKEEKRHEKEVEKEKAKREKEVKAREKHATAAVVADGKRAKDVEEEVEGVDKDGKDDTGSKAAAAGAAGLAGGAATGAGLAAASKDENKGPQSTNTPASVAATEEPRDDPKETTPIHPLVKVSSTAPPQRPSGPIALGAAAPHDRPKSGADSDFPLPSSSASATSVPKAVDLSGTGKDTVSEKRTSTSASSGAPTKEESLDRPRSRYLGTEGLMEKQQGGALRSSTIELMRNGRPSGSGQTDASANGNGNGNGKKEGFVRNLVEKVKDKLHHHDK